MIKKNKRYIPLTSDPLLSSVTITHLEPQPKSYPFNLPLIQNTNHIAFTKPVTFFVGENGTGKSTILEAIAHNVGFGPEGGSKNILFKTSQEQNYTGTALLAESMHFTWRYKPKNGYFFRAESFFNVANYLEDIGDSFLSYGGKSLHHQSHGESFLALFNNRLGDGGFFILDEPEAALSPQRQLSLIKIIHDLSKNNTAQFLIATHSPLLLAYPDATIYSCNGHHLEKITYEATDHYRITKSFLNDPERYMRLLLEDE